MRVQASLTRLRHLGARFFSSVRARPLAAADVRFVHDALQPGELECWERLGRADRAESVTTARAALALLERAPGENRAGALDAGVRADVVAAALLHDVGKAETGLGPVGRSVATAVAAVAGRARARSWTNAIGRYVNHDRLGAERLAAAGARPPAVSWAAAHHRPETWPGTGIPPEMCRILALADGEVVPE